MRPQAARAAAAIREALGVEAELELGARGEFSVLVNGRRVARRGFLGAVPPPEKVVGRVRRALEAAEGSPGDGRREG